MDVVGLVAQASLLRNNHTSWLLIPSLRRYLLWLSGLCRCWCIVQYMVRNLPWIESKPWKTANYLVIAESNPRLRLRHPSNEDCTKRYAARGMILSQSGAPKDLSCLEAEFNRKSGSIHSLSPREKMLSHFSHSWRIVMSTAIPTRSPKALSHIQCSRRHHL
jgi:hypothetical protein